MRRMYSKGQVIDVVNKAIEDGEISGGTKLYRHNITFTNTDDNEEVGLEIISASSTIVVDRNTLLDVVNNYIAIKTLTRMGIDEPPPSYYSCIGYVEDYLQIKYLNGNIVASYTLQLDYMEDYSDRVIPL